MPRPSKVSTTDSKEKKMTEEKKRGTALTFPRTLKVGCYDWTIQLVEDLREKETGAKLYGQCDPTMLTIRINSGINNDQIEAETLWHEIMHAVWSFFHLDDKEDEETAVSCLATGTAMVMKDNPLLRKFFWEIWK